MAASDSPVWLLDVDGVINIDRSAWHAAPRRATLYADAADWVLRWAPACAEAITGLHRRGLVEVRWCSTWCIAPDQLRRLEGLMRLPEFASALPADMGLNVDAHKTAAAERILAEGRRLVWTDDEVVPDPDREPQFYAELTAGGRALLIRPTSRRGLTPAHLDEITAFCTRAAAIAGGA